MTTEYSEELLQQIERYARARLMVLPCREYHLATILELIEEVRRLRTENGVLKTRRGMTSEAAQSVIEIELDSLGWQ